MNLAEVGLITLKQGNAPLNEINVDPSLSTEISLIPLHELLNIFEEKMLFDQLVNGQMDHEIQRHFIQHCLEHTLRDPCHLVPFKEDILVCEMVQYRS